LTASTFLILIAANPNQLDISEMFGLEFRDY